MTSPALQVTPPPLPISQREAQRIQREEVLRQKEIQRKLKEEAKLDLLERAKLEVEAYENEVQMLQTVHRECSQPMDWEAIAFSLPPHQPLFSSPRHLEASLKCEFSHPRPADEGKSSLSTAWQEDTEKYQKAIDQYKLEYEKWTRQQSLAQRILDGDRSAYPAAIKEFCWFGEIDTWGDAFSFSCKDSKHGDCSFPINGNDIIPSEVKTLSAAGKLSTKQTPKGRFHELYQAYVCGCCLRVAREIFALLPLDEVVVTATVFMLCTSTGLDKHQPVLSVRFDKKTIESLNFERLDPADALLNFHYNGVLKGSQKNDQFAAISPLVSLPVEERVSVLNPFDACLENVQAFRKTLGLGTKSKKQSTKQALASSEFITEAN